VLAAAFDMLEADEGALTLLAFIAVLDVGFFIFAAYRIRSEWELQK
jgi:hypothetical protein